MEISNLAATNTPVATSEPSTTIKSAKNEVSEDDKASVKSKISPEKETENVIMNKDGDTLEISNARLANYSKGKLMQLLQAGKISRQQYNKAMKSK